MEGELKLRDKVVDVLHVPMLKTGGFCGGHPMSFGLGADARRPPWGAGVDALALVGVDGAPGVFAGEAPTEVLTEVVTALGQHRVWERFGATL